MINIKLWRFKQERNITLKGKCQTLSNKNWSISVAWASSRRMMALLPGEHGKTETTLCMLQTVAASHFSRLISWHFHSHSISRHSKLYWHPGAISWESVWIDLAINKVVWVATIHLSPFDPGILLHLKMITLNPILEVIWMKILISTPVHTQK